MLDRRYRLTSTNPGKISFYERLEMDSRQVALAHTGGLSGPQQVGMCLFSLYELLDDNYAYKESIMNILKKDGQRSSGPWTCQNPRGTT